MASSPACHSTAQKWCPSVPQPHLSAITWHHDEWQVHHACWSSYEPGLVWKQPERVLLVVALFAYSPELQMEALCPSEALQMSAWAGWGLNKLL